MPTDTPSLILAWTAFALLAFGAALCWGFVWRYSRMDWRLYPEGRHIMIFTGTLALMMSMTLVFNLLPIPMLVRLVVSVVLFGAFDYALIRRHQLLREEE